MMQASHGITAPSKSGDLPAHDIDAERILIVDDEESIRRIIGARLRLRGYSVTLTGNGEDALRYLRLASHALVILDVRLPDKDGFAVLGEIRRNSDIPVLMLTGCGELENRITALHCGADDYLIKPFSLAELEARIRCLLRRASADHQGSHGITKSIKTGILEIDGLRIDLYRRQAHRQGRKVMLTGMEATMLELLIAANGLPVSRKEILQRIWGYSQEECQGLRLVDGHVSKLRRKLEDNPDNPRLILTKRGYGYTFCILSHGGGDPLKA